MEFKLEGLYQTVGGFGLKMERKEGTAFVGVAMRARDGVTDRQEALYEQGNPESISRNDDVWNVVREIDP